MIKLTVIRIILIKMFDRGKNTVCYDSEWPKVEPRQAQEIISFRFPFFFEIEKVYALNVV